MDSPPGITYQTQLPLSWQIAAPDAGMLAMVRRSNLELLHALATLETVSDSDHDINPAIAKAIDRLESKLDIAIGMISRMIAQHSDIPAQVPVSLGVEKIEWYSNNPLPSPGTPIRLELHLSPRLPEPLQLYAHVIHAPTGMCAAEFIDRDEELEEWMTRTLFRYHRRELQARHQP